MTSQGSWPPAAVDFIRSSDAVKAVNPVMVVFVRVIPVVVLQLGSRTASANSMRISVATPANAAGTLPASAFS